MRQEPQIELGWDVFQPVQFLEGGGQAMKNLFCGIATGQTHSQHHGVLMGLGRLVSPQPVDVQLSLSYWLLGFSEDKLYISCSNLLLSLSPFWESIQTSMD